MRITIEAQAQKGSLAVAARKNFAPAVRLVVAAGVILGALVVAGDVLISGYGYE